MISSVRNSFVCNFYLRYNYGFRNFYGKALSCVFNDFYCRKHFVCFRNFYRENLSLRNFYVENILLFRNCHGMRRYASIGTSPLVSADLGNCTTNVPWEAIEIHHYFSQSIYTMNLLCLYVSDILWYVREALQRKQTHPAYLRIKDTC